MAQSGLEVRCREFAAHHVLRPQLSRFPILADVESPAAYCIVPLVDDHRN
jgi:hypothetical protein